MSMLAPTTRARAGYFDDRHVDLASVTITTVLRLRAWQQHILEQEPDKVFQLTLSAQVLGGPTVQSCRSNPSLRHFHLYAHVPISEFVHAQMRLRSPRYYGVNFA